MLRLILGFSVLFAVYIDIQGPYTAPPPRPTATASPTQPPTPTPAPIIPTKKPVVKAQAAEGGITGGMAHYAPGVMERVCTKRGLCSEHNFASAWVPLGTWICVTSHTSGRTACGIVADVCHPNHCAAQRGRGLAAEAGWHTAVYLFPELAQLGVAGLSERDSPVSVTW